MITPASYVHFWELSVVISGVDEVIEHGGICGIVLIVDPKPWWGLSKKIYGKLLIIFQRVYLHEKRALGIRDR